MSHHLKYLHELLSVAVIRYYNPKHLVEEFILIYGSRGGEVKFHNIEEGKAPNVQRRMSTPHRIQGAITGSEARV